MTLTIYPPTDTLVEADCLACFDTGTAFVDETSLRLVKSLPCGSCRPISRKAALRRAGR